MSAIERIALGVSRANAQDCAANETLRAVYGTTE
jgi:hypothetical protein